MFRTKKAHPVTVRAGEETFTLMVNCMTPRKLKAFMDKVAQSENRVEEIAAINSSVIVGWKGVFDEEGTELPFSAENLDSLQMDNDISLPDTIYSAIALEAGEIRRANFTSMGFGTGEDQATGEPPQPQTPTQ